MMSESDARVELGLQFHRLIDENRFEDAVKFLSTHKLNEVQLHFEEKANIFCKLLIKSINHPDENKIIYTCMFEFSKALTQTDEQINLSDRFICEVPDEVDDSTNPEGLNFDNLTLIGLLNLLRPREACLVIIENILAAIKDEKRLQANNECVIYMMKSSLNRGPVLGLLEERRLQLKSGAKAVKTKKSDEDSDDDYEVTSDDENDTVSSRLLKFNLSHEILKDLDKNNLDKHIVNKSDKEALKYLHQMLGEIGVNLLKPVGNDSNLFIYLMNAQRYSLIATLMTNSRDSLIKIVFKKDPNLSAQLISFINGVKNIADLKIIKTNSEEAFRNFDNEDKEVDKVFKDVQKTLDDRIATLDEERIKANRTLITSKTNDNPPTKVTKTDSSALTLEDLLKSCKITIKKEKNDIINFHSTPGMLKKLHGILKQIKINDKKYQFQFGSFNQNSSVLSINWKGNAKAAKLDEAKLITSLSKNLHFLKDDDSTDKEKPDPTKDSSKTKSTKQPLMLATSQVDGWRAHLHSAFCYSDKVNVVWIDDLKTLDTPIYSKDKETILKLAANLDSPQGPFFLIDLSNLPPSAKFLLKGASADKNKTDVVPPGMYDTMIDDLSDYCNRTGLATFTRHHDKQSTFLVIVPNANHANLNIAYVDFYERLSKVIANAIGNAEPAVREDKKNSPSIGTKKKIVTPSSTQAEPKEEKTVDKSEFNVASILTNLNNLFITITGKNCQFDKYARLISKSKNNKLSFVIDPSCQDHLGNTTPKDYFMTLMEAAKLISPNFITMPENTDEIRLEIDFSDPNVMKKFASSEDNKKALKYFNDKLPHTSIEFDKTNPTKLEPKEKPEIEIQEIKEVPEIDLSKAMVNAVKDVLQNPSTYNNLFYSINALKALKPSGQNNLQETVNHLRYQLHSFSLAKLLKSKEKGTNVNYEARNVLRHVYLDKPFSELFELYNQSVLMIAKYAEAYRTNALLTFYTMEGTENQIFKSLQVALQDTGINEVQIIHDKDQAGLLPYKKLILDIENNAAMTDTERKEAIVMLHIVIGANKCEKDTVSGDIYRAAHEPTKQAFADFVDDMYQQHKANFVLPSQLEPKNNKKEPAKKTYRKKK